LRDQKQKENSTMLELTINVSQVEEWQTIQNIDALDQVFTRAQRVITGGGTVELVRQQSDGTSYKFDELSTIEELQVYKKSVYKYLG
jgi:hypothetical protein